MNEIYEFLRGPCLRATAFIFVIATIWRLAYLYGLSRERDRVHYNHKDLKWALRSIFQWLLPLGSRSMRSKPAFSIASYIFHMCLFVVPMFLSAHNTLWRESFGWSFRSMPDSVADALTILFMTSVVFLVLRRLVRPEVRILSSPWDYILPILVLLPFLTGFLAYHQVGPYRAVLVLHVLCGELLLIIVPFTKIGHFILFFFTRTFIGYEMGARRGARPW
jgi:nitrate reductase gamma subunit